MAILSSSDKAEAEVDLVDLVVERHLARRMGTVNTLITKSSIWFRLDRGHHVDSLLEI